MAKFKIKKSKKIVAFLFDYVNSHFLYKKHTDSDVFF